ncbi:Uncharacterised protein [Clostridioides difficile]|nr:Uncharacterised protein [Clostridioides difficile]SJP69829.1 Uncharacterised protein [Clostridioides difficile]SJW29665.1 Uncharacterised protein [Clostridioides difficile]
MTLLVKDLLHVNPAFALTAAFIASVVPPTVKLSVTVVEFPIDIVAPCFPPDTSCDILRAEPVIFLTLDTPKIDLGDFVIISSFKLNFSSASLILNLTNFPFTFSYTSETFSLVVLFNNISFPVSVSNDLTHSSCCLDSLLYVYSVPNPVDSIAYDVAVTAGIASIAIVIVVANILFILFDFI